MLLSILLKLAQKDIMHQASILGSKSWNNATAHINCNELVPLWTTAVSSKPVTPMKCTHTPNPQLSHIQRPNLHFLNILISNRLRCTDGKVIALYKDSIVCNSDVLVFK